MFILDCHLIETIYEWALTNKPDYEKTQALLPIMEAIRTARHWETLSAIENSWPKDRDPKIPVKDYLRPDTARISRIHEILYSLKGVDERTFKRWIQENRRYSLPYENKKVRSRTRAYLAFEAKDFAQVIISNWILILTLMTQIEAHTDFKNLEICVENYNAWVMAVEPLGVGILQEILFLARLVFFGGSIQLQNSRKLSAAKMLKKGEWLRYSKVATARNAAFDLHLVQYAREFRFGVRNGIVVEEPVHTGILSCDLLIDAMIRATRGESIQESRLVAEYEFPKDSPLSNAVTRAEIEPRLRTLSRMPGELKDSEQLVDILDQVIREHR